MKYHLYQFRTKDHYEPIWLRTPLQAEDRRYPLMVNYAGYSRCLNGWRNYRKKSDIYAIEYVCSGEAFLIQDGKEHIIRKGEIFLLRKDAEHTYGVGPAGFLLKRFIAIDGLELENLLRFLNLWGKDVIVPKEPGTIEKLLKQFTKSLSDTTTENMDMQFSSMIYRVLMVLYQSLESSTPPIIEKAIEYIQNNLNSTLSRKDISTHVGISMTHLNKIFFQHFECSPMKYFVKRKLAWAAQLISRTKYSIKEIAFITGYEDPLYFSAQFKKYFGVSPRNYRHTEKTHAG
jgi:AraC-like DNA-binding protein